MIIGDNELKFNLKEERKTEVLILDEAIINQIYSIRGQQVILDTDLANLYQAETKQLKTQVKTKCRSFPDDFMFGVDPRRILCFKEPKWHLETRKY